VPFADYVIESGASDGWNYQKWNSGKLTLEKYISLSGIAVTDSYGAVYISAMQTVSIPSINIMASPIVNITAFLGGAWVTGAATPTASSFLYYILNPTSFTTSTNRGMSVQITGAWR
jgi:hypothetical protein